MEKWLAFGSASSNIVRFGCAFLSVAPSLVRWTLTLNMSLCGNLHVQVEVAPLFCLPGRRMPLMTCMNRSGDQACIHHVALACLLASPSSQQLLPANFLASSLSPVLLHLLLHLEASFSCVSSSSLRHNIIMAGVRNQS